MQRTSNWRLFGRSQRGPIECHRVTLTPAQLRPSLGRPPRLAAYLVILAALFSLSACVSAPPSPEVTTGPFATEIAAYKEADRKSAPAPCQVLFVGSSTIANWTSLSSDMAPIATIGRGFGGSEIAHVNYWFDQIVAPYRPSAIVFYAGENDVDVGKSVNKILVDFTAFLKLKKRTLGSIPVYFVSIKPSRYRFSQIGVQAQVNARIRKLAAQREDLEYIDIVDAMLESGQPKDLFVADGIHMTSKGYAIWTAAIRPTLLKQSDTQTQSCNSRL